MNSIIYHSKTSGLANRLRALVSYQALASCLNIPFFLCWTPDWACNCEFENLFYLNSIQTLKESDLIRQIDSQIYSTNRNYNTVWKQDVKNHGIPWKSFQKKIVYCIQELQPTETIQKEINQFLNAHDLKKVYGIHIRMTDNLKGFRISSRFNSKRFPELSSFINFINQKITENPRQVFFLATDNKNIEKYLTKKFGNRMLVYQKRFQRQFMFSFHNFMLVRKKQRTTSIEIALIELLLLSRCKHILGTYWSSYSKLAAIWGGVPYLEAQGNEYVSNKSIEDLLEVSDSTNKNP